jgi:hypothetical protein
MHGTGVGPPVNVTIICGLLPLSLPALRYKANEETAVVPVVIGAPLAGIFDRRPHVPQDPEVFEKAALRDTDLPGEMVGGSGTFVINEIVKPDKAIQLGHHSKRFNG